MNRVGIEHIPLLESNREAELHLNEDGEEDDTSQDLDNTEEDKVLFAEGQQRGTSLLINDSVLLIVESIQFFALLQSLSFRWAWPLEWLQNFSFVFAFNLDIWEIVKIATNGTYKSLKFYNTPSSDVPMEYWHYVLMWCVLVLLGLLGFVISFWIMRKKKSSYMLIQIARLQKFYVIAVQVSAIPVGVMIGKLFHCSDNGMMDVSNDVYCYQGIHWAYLAPAILFLLTFYILFPVWLILTTKKETLGLSSANHEGYLQLKETEYTLGMDLIYIVANFHIFSSFRRYGVHFRAALHILKFVVIIFYATLFQFVQLQAIVLTVIFFCLFVAFTILRPFRVSIFNTMLILNYFMLTANSLMGAMIASFNSFNVQSVWFTPDYSYYVLVFIQGLWLILTLSFLLYIILRYFMLCICVRKPLWPSLTAKGLDNVSVTTKKYIRGILRARLLLDKSLSLPPLFTPVHELARQIQIINAYTREAELLNDPLHDTLWDLLDELIDVHTSLSPKSLFAESIKDSIRHTSNELMKMMPLFSKRVNERDYDFILVSPVKKRMLLKMYCLGIFLNGRSEKLKKEKQYSSAMKKLWTFEDKNEVDDGYYEDMYPAAPEITAGLRKNNLGVIIDLDSDEEQADERYLQEVEDWTQLHPLSRQATAAGNDEVTAILNRDDSIDFNTLMAGIPNLPGTPPDSERSSSSHGGKSSPQVTTVRLVTLEEQPSFEDSPLVEEIVMDPSGVDNQAFEEDGAEPTRFGSRSLSRLSRGSAISQETDPNSGRKTSVASFKAPSGI